MTEDLSQFPKLASQDKGYVTFGDNNKGKIIGKGTIGNTSNFFIEDVLLVDGLKHNLLSISVIKDILLNLNLMLVLLKNHTKTHL